MLEKKLGYIAIVIVLLYGFYNAITNRQHKEEGEKSQSSTQYRQHIEKHKESNHYAEELSQVNTVNYARDYIIRVIEHGSEQFDFKGGVMEGGFASREDAPRIACYVLSLSGKKCVEPQPKDAKMFYTSICGGCHGDDGKGLGGTYPDLTRKKLLGIERREAFLREKVDAMRKSTK